MLNCIWSKRYLSDPAIVPLQKTISKFVCLKLMPVYCFCNVNDAMENKDEG